MERTKLYIRLVIATLAATVSAISLLFIRHNPWSFREQGLISSMILSAFRRQLDGSRTWDGNLWRFLSCSLLQAFLDYFAGRTRQ